MSIETAIAANRFGLGARPGELEKLDKDPKTALLDQLQGPSAASAELAKLPRSEKVLAEVLRVRKQQRELKKKAGDESPPKNAKKYGSLVRSHYMDQVEARFTHAVRTDYPFYERLVRFWSNHFAVSTDKQPISALAGLYENEAIRPNLNGSFFSLLLAAETHPAMILYLDNERSIGPGSAIAKPRKKRRSKKRNLGINENLAREILELHTLGVDGGYRQADVTAFANVLTGWSVGSDQGRFKAGTPGAFVYRNDAHEPGSQVIMGQRYQQPGFDQGVAVLRKLAMQPSTARFIASKLVRHFVDDQPPPAMVERIAAVFLKSGGSLPEVHAALVHSKEPWQIPLAKYKTPEEFVISSYRAFDYVPRRMKTVVGALEQMGQMPMRPGSPEGWPDTAEQWGGADALYKRIEWANAAARLAGSSRNPLEIGEQSLGANFSENTRMAIMRAESVVQGTTLLLASPDFQRR
jgi:uncharacterized protein (DUF1800 family)